VVRHNNVDISPAACDLAIWCNDSPLGYVVLLRSSFGSVVLFFFAGLKEGTES